MSSSTLKTKNGNINNDQIIIIQHQWSLIPKPEKEQEIVKLKKILNKEYNPDEPVQRYLKKLQNTRKNLTKLKANPGTPKMICQAIDTFEQHTELEEVTYNWQMKSDTIQEQWDEMKKKYFIAEIKKKLKTTQQPKYWLNFPTWSNKKSIEWKQKTKKTSYFLHNNLLKPKIEPKPYAQR